MSQYIISSASIDDRDANMTYTGNWSRSYWPDLYKTTETFSDDQGATATVHFWGTAVEYWGNSYYTHGPCDISLDGSYISTVNAYAAERTDPWIIFSRNNLALRDHTLSITVRTSSDTNRCEVDRFVVNVTKAMDNNLVTTSDTLTASIISHTASTDSSTTPSTSTPTSAGPFTSTASRFSSGSLRAASISISFPSSGNPVTVTIPIGSDIADVSKSKSGSVPTSAIIGAVVGSVIFIAIIIILCLWYRRSRHTKFPLLTSYVIETVERAPLRSSTPMTAHSDAEDAMSQASNFSPSDLPTSSGHMHSSGVTVSNIPQKLASSSPFYSPPPAYVAIHRNL